MSNGAGEKMQAYFPEGYVFTWALYGLASARVVGQLEPDDVRRTHQLAEAWRAVEALRSNQARSTFIQEMSPNWGVFYSSWSLYVLAEYVRAAGSENVSNDVLQLFMQEADLLAQAIESNESPFLEAYPHLAWPADTCVGIAALGIYDEAVEPRYEKIVRNWTLKARRLLDDELGALSHAADPITGSPIGGVRGGSLALMSRVLVDADPELAREQYAILRNNFVDYRLGVPGVREYPHGVRGNGDIDSGPVILGFAGPAVVVGAAAARANGDIDLANTLLGGVEAGGLPIEILGRRRYAGGLIPVADAFIVWARTSPAPSEQVFADGRRVVPRMWRLPIHTVSLFLCLVMFWRGR
ncbi:MAG: hypothetical protein QNJ46_15220 [Leptolyngbyaceae cyanobacterium MO_188.B28]|nr:hypothetical protein [Leptolyngbyaceae cyanobacterium MO_188.B28]